MLGKTSIIIFLLLANLLAHAGLSSELEMLKDLTNIEITAWDSSQASSLKKPESINNGDSISLTSSALRKPAILESDELELLKSRAKKSEFKTTRKRSR
jgi:hypothetical protein